MSRGGLLAVSAGLGLRGGGAAALGRLVVSCAEEYCRSASLPFGVLHLGAPDGTLPGLPARHFGGDQKGLALALALAQVRGPKPALVFDRPGPARVQSFLPAAVRAPYAVFLLGSDVAGPLGWDRRRALEGAAIPIAISETTSRSARRVVPGLSPEVLHPALEERPPSGILDRGLISRTGDGYFLIVGRMSASERYKGHDALLDVLRDLDPSARLVVAGDGDDRSRLEARARALELGDRVLFTGFVDEATLAELYGRCRAFVMPSAGEGFGLVYLEAMRAAKPCVALRGGAAEEIVVDRETGLLVDATADSLREALASLQADASLASRLGQAGRRRYQALFRRERFSTGFARHLDRLLGRSA